MMEFIPPKGGNPCLSAVFLAEGMQLDGRCGNSGDANDKLKYNGKELDKETGYHHYGWREYDAAIGRFNRPDRFADKYPWMSPYSYAACNPIVFIDRNGDSIEVIGQYSNQALTSMQKQSGNDGNRISIVNGFVQINREGYKAGSNNYLDKLIAGVDAKQKIGLEITGSNGVKESQTEKYEKSGLPVIDGAMPSNASTTHRFTGDPNEANLPHGASPPTGYDGYVKVTNAVNWFRPSDGTSVPLSTIVGHELIENIQRTISNFNYKNAHNEANKTCFGGTNTDGIYARVIKEK